jgi:hypothetical protein
MVSKHLPEEPWRPVLAKARQLTGFSEEDERTLGHAAETLQPFAAEISAAFYDTLYACEGAAAIFRDLEQDRAVREATLRQWYVSLLSGNYDDRFWTWHWLVGLVHVQHGVDHVFVMSMFGRLQTLVVAKAFEIFEETSAERVIQAFLRITSCLAALTVEAFHHEYLQAVQDSGIKDAVLSRMVSMEVQKKIQHYRRVLGHYPIH